jgi:thiosulfate reductase cytochrome b subunit
VLFRAGLAGAGAVRTLARFFLFPFTLLYLLLYATTVHFRRVLRGGNS